MLCQFSPKDTTASGHRLVLWSVDPSDWRPNVWHSELIDQVTWWSRAIRTSPAHTSAIRAPTHDPEMAYPMAKGMANEASARRGNSFPISTRSRSFNMSGA